MPSTLANIGGPLLPLAAAPCASAAEPGRRANARTAEPSILCMRNPHAVEVAGDEGAELATRAAERRSGSVSPREMGAHRVRESVDATRQPVRVYFGVD